MSLSGNRNHAIIFKHPGYAVLFDQNVLLKLYGFDEQHRDLHHGTALVACAIVAGNAWSGYFTHERDGERIQLEYDDVLSKTSYYFYVPSPTAEVYKYPIYPSFEHWSFPHSNLPPAWSTMALVANRDSNDDDSILAPQSASNLTSAILRRDRCCRITGQRDYIETAHLCPQGEAMWFDSNSMGQYNLNGELSSDFIVDDVSNAIALRSDIHSAFDDRKFVIAPKESQWAVHFPSLTNDLGQLYHNTAISLDPIVSANFILARFAWAIFPLVRKFLEVGVDRELRLRVTQKGEFRKVIRTAPAEEARKMSIDARGRNSSPKKRKAGLLNPDYDNSRTLKLLRRDKDITGNISKPNVSSNCISILETSSNSQQRVLERVNSELSPEIDNAGPGSSFTAYSTSVSSSAIHMVIPDASRGQDSDIGELKH